MKPKPKTTKRHLLGYNYVLFKGLVDTWTAFIFSDGKSIIIPTNIRSEKIIDYVNSKGWV